MSCYTLLSGCRLPSMNPQAFTRGLDYTLSQTKKNQKERICEAHQHLVSELHPWYIYRYIYFRTWLRIAQSSKILTIPYAINIGHTADLSVRAWYLEALRGFPQFDGVAKKRRKIYIDLLFSTSIGLKSIL